MIQTGQRHHATEVVVLGSARPAKQVLGYVRIADLLTSHEEWRDTTRPLIAIRHDAPQLSAMVRLQSQGETLAQVVDGGGRTVGILSTENLLAPLIQER